MELFHFQNSSLRFQIESPFPETNHCKEGDLIPQQQRRSLASEFGDCNSRAPVPSSRSRNLTRTQAELAAQLQATQTATSNYTQWEKAHKVERRDFREVSAALKCSTRRAATLPPIWRLKGDEREDGSSFKKSLSPRTAKRSRRIYPSTAFISRWKISAL